MIEQATSRRLTVIEPIVLKSHSSVPKLLADALSKDNFDFAKRCLDEQKLQGETSVQLHVSQARIMLATEPFPADLDRWLSERQDELSSDSDRKQFFDEMLNVVADQGKARLAKKTLKHSVTKLAEGEITTMLWAATQKALTSRVMRFLNDQDDHPVSTSIQTEMLYRLIQHLPESSPHLERLGELAIRILDCSPELEPIQRIKLGYVLEHLQLPELAISACQKALSEDGSPSLFEHYIIWLRCGYLRNLPSAQTELDQLVRVFGPREDLMDTRVVLFLRDQNAVAAAEISRDLALHDTLHRAYQANDRLASALLQPDDKREEALIEVEQRYGSDLSLLAKQILRDHLTLD